MIDGFLMIGGILYCLSVYKGRKCGRLEKRQKKKKKTLGI